MEAQNESRKLEERTYAAHSCVYSSGIYYILGGSCAKFFFVGCLQKFKIIKALDVVQYYKKKQIE